ncbi:hypothetical protein [Streptomyces sp. RKCA744]|uniref:hypothetical protein n=1 Tax=Streptomyces sp. RKCA744 TaxID=2959340 RepID=UPI00209C7587|nr:hypothetical protein [Streptomyces sp. RKCA744]MCO8308826.1 hypothetical protein [Streptomyces sp. RKCA744]
MGGATLTYTSYPGSSNSNSYWPERGNTAAKSSWEICKDINIKVNSTRDVTVCFIRTGSCNGWHRATAGQWKVIASSVLPGTSFYLQFKGAARSSFKLAF